MNNSIFRNQIVSCLKKHINNDYVLLGLPTHMNLGDTLIWEAEEDILNEINYKCLNMYFWGNTNINVSENTIIIFSGGGSWDDIWNTIDYIEQILLKYNNNKFIFLPNDVWYDNLNRVNKTIDIINKHNNDIILCSRNKQSYDLANKCFPNITNELIPDVVLGWNIDKFLSEHNLYKELGNGNLHITRNDKEKINYTLNINFNCISDWPEMTIRPKYANTNISCKNWHDNVKPLLVKSAIQFINKFSTIYSSRMHGAILALLLDKQTVFIDNSYHKTKSLYDTWLNKIPDTKLFTNVNEQ